MQCISLCFGALFLTPFQIHSIPYHALNPWFFLKSFGMNYLNYLRKGSRKIFNETMIHIRYFLSKLLSIFFSLSIVSDLFVSPNVYKFCEWRLCRVVCFSVFFLQYPGHWLTQISMNTHFIEKKIPMKGYQEVYMSIRKEHST